MKLYIIRIATGGYAAVILVSVLYFLYTLPTFGWDALSFWAPKVIEFVNAYNVGADAPVYSIREHRHPPAVILLQSGALYLASGNTMLPMALPFLLFLCVVFFIPHKMPMRKRIVAGCLLAAYTLAAAPLLANHYQIYGYTEVYIGSSMLLALTLWQKGYCLNEGRMHFLFAILCALFPLIIKNTGVLYTAAVFLSFLMMGVWSSGVSRVTKFSIFGCLVAASAIPVITIWHLSWTSTWMASEFSNDVAGRTLWFGGYPLQFSYVGIVEVSLSIIQAIFVNQSFGILFLVYLVAFSVAVTGRHGNELNKHEYSVILVSICAAFTCAAFTLPQLVSERVYAFSAPGMDTGYSRFLIPAAMLSPMLLFSIYYLLQNKCRVRMLDEPLESMAKPQSAST